MIYSVWNQGTVAYDYYETPEVQKVLNTPPPRHIPAKDKGATVDQAAWPLPVSARRIGSGDFAKGRVASRKTNGAPLGSINMDSSTIGILGLGIAAFVLWRNGFFK